MKLTLIKRNIGRREHSLYVDDGRMEPLPLGILAALTPSDIDVVLYDDRMEPIPYDEPTDIVAITVETFTARRAYEISEEYQKRGVSVIMGGMHAKLIPNEVAEHCDCVIIGDAEPVWAQMCADFRAGQLKKRYTAAQPQCPQEGIISPEEFIQYLEEEHMSSLLDMYIVETVLREFEDREKVGLPIVPVSAAVFRR